MIGFPKPTGSRKVARANKRITLKTAEDKQKDKVRVRDRRRCRFPRCGCKRFNLALHVSHQHHKGMGGNPAGDRSTTDQMVLVCSARHRENEFAIDRGTIRWRALTDKGADGPIAWDIDYAQYWKLERPRHGERWQEIAREYMHGTVGVFTGCDNEVLDALRAMDR